MKMKHKQKQKPLGLEFYKFYIKHMGVSGIITIIIGVAFVISSMILIDPNDVKLKYRIGFMLLMFGVYIITSISCSIAIFEKKYRKNILLLDYSLDKINIKKPYTIVEGRIGIGKTIFIESMREYDSKMQFVETQNVLYLPINVRLNASKIIRIEMVYENDSTDS